MRTLLLSLFACTALQEPARTPDIFYVPSRHAVVDGMLQFAKVTKNDVVYDLGSGDGRIAILAAQKYGAVAVGIELDPKLVALARQIAKESEVSDRVTFIEGDLFTADISKATVVTLYPIADSKRAVGIEVAQRTAAWHAHRVAAVPDRQMGA